MAIDKIMAIIILMVSIKLSFSTSVQLTGPKKYGYEDIALTSLEALLNSTEILIPRISADVEVTFNDECHCISQCHRIHL